jgi:hypothetical protein
MGLLNRIVMNQRLFHNRLCKLLFSLEQQGWYTICIRHKHFLFVLFKAF